MTEPRAPKELDPAAWRLGRDGRSVVIGVKGSTKPLVHGTEAASVFDLTIMAYAKQLYAMLDDASVELKLAGCKTGHIDKLLEAIREKVPQ